MRPLRTVCALPRAPTRSTDCARARRFCYYKFMLETIAPPKTRAPLSARTRSRPHKPTRRKRSYPSRRQYMQKDDELLREISDAYETPAAALAYGILALTIADLRARDFLAHSNALAFVRSPHFARLVAALELDVDAVRARCETIAAARH